MLAVTLRPVRPLARREPENIGKPVVALRSTVPASPATMSPPASNWRGPGRGFRPAPRRARASGPSAGSRSFGLPPMTTTSIVPCAVRWQAPGAHDAPSANSARQTARRRGEPSHPSRSQPQAAVRASIWIYRDGPHYWVRQLASSREDRWWLRGTGYPAPRRNAGRGAARSVRPRSLDHDFDEIHEPVKTEGAAAGRSSSIRWRRRCLSPCCG